MPEHPAIVGADAPPSRAAAGGGSRPRRRFVTEPTDSRLFRVCRWPKPTAADPDHCRCGAGLDRTAASKTGYRHRPATRRPRPVVNVAATPELTLSAVLDAPRSGAGAALAPLPPGELRDITIRDAIAAAAVTFAIADHLSPRTAAALDPDDPRGRARRIEYVTAALSAALRCPLCGPDLVRAGVARRG